MQELTNRVIDISYYTYIIIFGYILLTFIVSKSYMKLYKINFQNKDEVLFNFTFFGVIISPLIYFYVIKLINKIYTIKYNLNNLYMYIRILSIIGYILLFLFLTGYIFNNLWFIHTYYKAIELPNWLYYILIN